MAGLFWIQSLFQKLELHTFSPHILWCDNLSTFYLITNLAFHAQTKYIEIDFHYVREHIFQM